MIQVLTEKRAYLKPMTKVVETIVDVPFMTGSYMTGGHNQGSVGGNLGDSKQNWIEDEESEE